MKCKVKIRLKQIECPGTLHLPTRLPVYISICLFGQLKRSDDVYPSFPLKFNSSIIFQRYFTNAKNPDQVMEILEDETVTIELKQYTKCGKGCQTLAQYEKSARLFLFPSQFYVSKMDGLLREILLHKTSYLRNIKILDPKFIFSSTTTFEDQLADEISPQLKKQLHTDNLETKQAISCKTPVKKDFQNHYLKGHSNPELMSKSLKEDLQRSTESLETSENKRYSRHCICECPVLNDIDFSLKAWLKTLKLNVKKNFESVRPFRTGKAPETLLSARHFENPERREKQKQALCKFCSVPSKVCTLCNAYKTVYGSENFLFYRFKNFENILSSQKNHKDLSEDFQRHQNQAKNDKHKLKTPSSSSECKQYKGNKMHPNMNPKVNFSPVYTTYSYANLFESSSCSTSDDDNPIRVVKKRRAEHFSEAYDYKPATGILFNEETKDFGRWKKNFEKSSTYNYCDTSAIQNRIKELMKKNKTVLEREILSPALSYSSVSSSSLSSSENDSADGVVVKPSSWRGRHRDEMTGTLREKFDASLNSIYQDLYKKTLES